MCRTSLIGSALLLASLLVAVPAPGQELDPPRFRIVPRVGMVVPLNDMQQTARDTVMILRVRPETAFGIAVEYLRPGGHVDYRGALSYSRAMTLAGRGVQRWDSCGEGCIEPIIGGPRSPVGTTSFLAVHGDVLISLRQPSVDHRFTPRLIFGVGMKRFGIDDDSLDPSVAGRLNPDDSSILVYFGTEMSIRLARGIDLVTEVGDYFSFYDTSAFVVPPQIGVPVVVERNSWAHNDIFLSIGLRIPWIR